MIEHDNLEEFADPDTYDLDDDSDTGVAFYAGLARETGGPVLELACGTGRVALPIARLGFAVTGLDIVPGMLERARRKSAGLPARWVAGDARAFDLGERFRLIFLTGNAFQALLTRADQEALLARVRAHLDDEGLFAFETRNPRWANLTTRAEEYDGLFALLETRERERTRTTRIAVRFTFPRELEALLHYNGFALVRQYGDWNMELLTAASPSIIVVCRKRA
jgi:SAM-dependent methyltransferase